MLEVARACRDQVPAELGEGVTVEELVDEFIETAADRHRQKYSQHPGPSVRRLKTLQAALRTPHPANIAEIIPPRRALSNLRTAAQADTDFVPETTEQRIALICLRLQEQLHGISRNFELLEGRLTAAGG